MKIEHIIIIALLLIQLLMTIYVNYSNYESYAGSTKIPDMKISGVQKPERRKKT